MSITIDQANLGNNAVDAGASSIAATTTLSAAANSFVVALVSWFTVSGKTLTSVTDNSGFGYTWTIDKQITAANNAGIALASTQTGASGLPSGTILTGTYSGAVDGATAIGATSFAGVATSLPAGSTAGVSYSAASGAWSSGSVAISSNSLLVGACTDVNSYGTDTPDAGITEAQDFGVSPTHFAVTLAYRVQASPGSYAISGTWTDTSALGAVVAVEYKAAAGGGAAFTARPLAVHGQAVNRAANF